jgi:hypothetical protein
LGIEPENLFAFSVQQELNGFLEVAKTFFLGLALTIRAWNFQTRRPKAAFSRVAPVNNGGKLFHATTYSSSCRGIKWFYFSIVTGGGGDGHSRLAPSRGAQPQHFRLVNDLHAKLLRLVQLGPGFRTGDNVIGFLADAAAARDCGLPGRGRAGILAA